MGWDVELEIAQHLGLAGQAIAPRYLIWGEHSRFRFAQRRKMAFENLHLAAAAGALSPADGNQAHPGLLSSSQYRDAPVNPQPPTEGFEINLIGHIRFWPPGIGGERRRRRGLL